MRSPGSKDKGRPLVNGKRKQAKSAKFKRTQTEACKELRETILSVK